MSYINPLTGTIFAAGQVQAHAAEEKTREARRAQVRARDVSHAGDRFEPHVENAEAISPVDDEAREHPPREKPKRQKPAKKEFPHLDVRG